MKKREDNITGVFLDADWERMVEVVLPLVKATKTTEYGNEILDHFIHYYGELMFLGDTHIGHEDHSINPFNAHLRFAKDHPHIRLGLMGDYVEYASKTRYINDEVMMPDDQIDLFVKKLKPVAKQIVFMLYGNHDERFDKYTGTRRFLKTLALELGLSDDVYVGLPQRGIYAAIKVGSRAYGLYAHHSKTGARINQELALKRMGSQNVFSIVAQGHIHKIGWYPRTFRQLEERDGKIYNVVRRQYLLQTGCFIKDPSYAEAGGYPYTVVGAPIVRFYATKPKLDMYDLTQDYKDYLMKGGEPFGAKAGASDDLLKEVKNCLTVYGVNHRCLS